MLCAMGFDKGIDYIFHCNALRWVLIRELIIFLIVMPCAMGFDKGIDYISYRYIFCAIGFDKEIDYNSHCNALRWVLIRKLIIFLVLMPCDGF